VCLYAGRLLNLLAATALTFLAVRVTPVGKWALAAFALTPETLFLSATLSPDALTNAFAFLFVAQVLACALGLERTVSARSLACLILLGAAIALSKQAYFLLTACYLLIPVGRMGTWRRYVAGFASVCGVTLLCVMAWGLVMRSTYSPPDPAMDIDAAERLRSILRDPIGFFGVLLRTAGRWQFILEQYLGFLGVFDARLPRWLWLSELAVLTLVCARDFGPASGVTVRQALVAAGVAVAVCFTVLVVVYATWDRPGAPWIAVQGRYFIPAGPLAGLSIGRALGSLPVGWQRMSRVQAVAVPAAFGVLLTATLLRMHERYFVDDNQAAAHRSFNRGCALQRAGASSDRVRQAFAEAVRLDPDHYLAHSYLGQMLAQSDPREAAEHFRAVLRQVPGDVVSLTSLANILYLELDYPEAIRLCREAVRLAPEDPNMRKNLAQAVHASEAMDAALRQVSMTLPKLAADDALLETRHRGTATEGLYFKPARGRIVDASGQAPFPQEFSWRCPPPSGEEIRLTGADRSLPGRPERAPFYACSATPAPKRMFVFPPPRGATLLADAAMSWFFQVPLADLNEVEAKQERDYRERLGLQFPLAKIPE
jgi:tetratricopeptide (TPR) repeat protein